MTEQVDGIARFHESMTLIRDENNTIVQLFDYQNNPISIQMLHLSYLSVSVEGGFWYKNDFIPMNDSIDIGKKRIQGYQRMKTLLGHKGEDVL